jgi:hypothetical protein
MLNTTKYYDEFLRYHEMADWQHHNCNLGLVPYADTPWDDDLIKNVYLYDVVERKYAGFTQLVLDMWYSYETHPYKAKMSDWRKNIVDSFDTSFWSLQEWLFVFFVHRLTGSGINYAQNPSGYYNSILLAFTECDDIDDMCEVIRTFDGPKFTSVGYQIAPFPKPQGDYVRGGDWFMCEVLPDMTRAFAEWLSKGQKDFRSMMDWLEDFNKSQGFRVFRFQYAATLADIADFFPKLVHRDSPFFYGKNAIECLNYLAKKPPGMSQIVFLDAVMDRIAKDTNSLPYNAEDIACDSIRWIENYINPKADYSHLCLDTTWSSHTIHDHPYGRQKPMLELGLVKTFNGNGHPSDDKILKDANMTIKEYKDAINSRV